MIYAIGYVAVIVIVNVMFGHGGWWALAANVLVGLGFIIRDYAQRELGRWVLLATAIGVAISAWYAPPGIATVSGAAFALSEVLDYVVVWWNEHRPMWQRVAISHFFSVPVDTAVFLGGLTLNTGLAGVKIGIGVPWAWTGFLVMLGMKFLALGVLWIRR